jgi:hypothetical protein
MSELTIRVADGGEQAAVATNAAARLLPPLRTLIADTAYAGIISTFQFTTVAGAIAYARAQGGSWRIVVGSGLTIPESPYTLADEGIYLDMPFDVWARYVQYGGLLDESELLYTVDESRLTFNIVG